MAHTETTDDPRLTLIDGVEGGYLIRSRTRPGLEHTVTVPAGTCTCEAGQHAIECWHLDFSRAVYYWHRYERRTQLWAARAARLAATTAHPAQPRGMAALQAGYPRPMR